MKVGIFVPIANNGWILSTSSPQYKPTWEFNRDVVQLAEKHGMDFALAMVKLRGWGGATEFWDYAHESFTLMAGLAVSTERIKLYASIPVLAMQPAIVARMTSTIESMAPGRFGVNIVSGWAEGEYSQMGIWPGEEWFGKRYDFSSEYVTVLRDLLERGRSDFKGEFFTMDDCVLQPQPSTPIEIVGAGQSDRGMQFCAEHCDFNFVLGNGVNNPGAHAANASGLQEKAAQTGRDVNTYVTTMVIAAETDEEAWARYEDYAAHADLEAIAKMTNQGNVDARAGSDSTARHMAAPEGSWRLNMACVVGSYENVARTLDEMAEVPGTGGLMFVFDDWFRGIEEWGTRVQPLMKSRVEEVAALA